MEDSKSFEGSEHEVKVGQPKRKKRRRFRKRHRSVVREMTKSPSSKVYSNTLVVVQDGRQRNLVNLTDKHEVLEKREQKALF